MAVTATKRKPPQPDPMGRKKAVVRVTPETIDEYGSLDSQIKLLESRRAELRAAILKERPGYPDGMKGEAYMVKFVDSVRRLIKWEQEAQELAEQYMSAAERETWRYNVIDRAEVAEVTAVKVEVRKEFMVAAQI